MLYFFFGVLMSLVGLIIALCVANVLVYAMLWDAPWLCLSAAIRGVDVLRNISYVPESDDPKHRLDLYRPRNKKHFPVVIFLHGGWWTSGDKEYYGTFTGLYANVGKALARNGIGAVIPNYRLAPTVPFEGMINDVARAVRWTQRRIADFGGDQCALFLAGHDAGGQMTALCALDKRILRDANVDLTDILGYIPMSAIYDLDDMASKTDASFESTITRPTFGMVRQSLSRWSPSMHIRLGSPQLLMLTAERDAAFIQKQAESTQMKLEELRAKPKSVVIPGYSHIDMVLKFGYKNDPVLHNILAFVTERTANSKTSQPQG